MRKTIQKLSRTTAQIHAVHSQYPDMTQVACQCWQVTHIKAIKVEYGPNNIAIIVPGYLGSLRQACTIRSHTWSLWPGIAIAI